MTEMIETTDDGYDRPIGIVLSMTLYAIYIYIADKLVQMFKIDNWIIFFIYFIPLIVFYIEIPILLRKSDRWQKYIE